MGINFHENAFSIVCSREIGVFECSLLIFLLSFRAIRIEMVHVHVHRNSIKWKFNCAHTKSFELSEKDRKSISNDDLRVRHTLLQFCCLVLFCFVGHTWLVYSWEALCILCHLESRVASVTRPTDGQRQNNDLPLVLDEAKQKFSHDKGARPRQTRL